jgi:hypothetical protein
MPPPLVGKTQRSIPKKKGGEISLSLQTEQTKISSQENNVKRAHQGRPEKKTKTKQGKTEAGRKNTRKVKGRKTTAKRKSVR